MDAPPQGLHGVLLPKMKESEICRVYWPNGMVHFVQIIDSARTHLFAQPQIMAICLTTNCAAANSILSGNMEKKYFNTKFSFNCSCLENRLIKPPQDVKESVEVIGKQKMNPWQSGYCKVFLLGWNRG